MQRYDKSLIFPNIIRNYSKGMKWNNDNRLKSTNFAPKTKKSAHNVATFKKFAYLCPVVS
jgi:hypothetical protein